MAKIKNKPQFDDYYKNREIISIEFNTDKNNNTVGIVTFGDYKVKKNEMSELKAELKELKDLVITGFKQVNTRLDTLDTKVDDLTVAVKELQSEAKSHGWNIKAELK